jgi:alcohol dehydrogenase class IV
MRFEFATASRIIFGPGACQHVPAAAMELGRRVLLVTGSSRRRAATLLEQLTAHGAHVSMCRITAEPTIDMVAAGCRQARENACDLIIGIGGGSVMDAGKAIAALMTNPGEPLDYVEVIGRGKPITEAAAPYIAIPTTAGTGAEVTRNAVLASPEHRVKVSLRSPFMLPRLAVVDPELTYGLPPDITATTGLDALTQLVEPFVSVKANPLTDALCREGMARAARGLVTACEDGGNADARQDMALASLLGGLALANAKLGAVHGIAGPLGGMFPAPHGAVCAALLAPVVAVNLEALRQREPGSPSLGRYDDMARLLTGSPTATAADGVAWLENTRQRLRVPSLANYGLTESEFPELIEKASRASSMQGNPVTLRHDELHEVLRRSL